MFRLVVWMRNQSTQGVVCVLSDATEFRFTGFIFMRFQGFANKYFLTVQL